MRTVVHAVSMELFGRSLRLDQFPVRPDITGLGLSDWIVYADRLAQKLTYTNTFYDREPCLDIRNVDPQAFAPVDFLIATDVFEHVAPPVDRAFHNVRRLLKSGGVFIFSVPYVTEPEARTQEHFPELHDFRIETKDGKMRVVNRTIDGRAQIFENPVFHGGDGLTLEMRLFSESSLRNDLQRAGLLDVKFYGQDKLRYGIHWPAQQSLVISARAGQPAALAS